MIPKKYRKELDRLIERYQQGTATAEEARFVEDYYNSFENKQGISEQLTDEEKEEWKGVLLAKIHERMLSGEQAPVVPLYRRKAFKWIAAACVIALVGVLANVWLRERSQVTGDRSHIATTHDVPAPTNTRAVITLANGSKVYLDSAGNGTIAQENNVNVVKNDKGEIVYNRSVTLSGVEASTVRYNTLFNPRGSKVISLTLCDGTRVWLNSESSLRYPAFLAPLASNREVEITGEAYFEVKHNAKQPFKVHLPNGSVIEDIGTSFNVNAYSDEADIKTTLIEGSARVMLSGDEASTRKGVILKPGQQALVNSSKAGGRSLPAVLRVTSVVDVNRVMAWKNGRFYFDGADIKTIMRQISRWYDVDVQYDADIKSSFVAKISTDVPVSQLLKIMELTDLVHFKVEGKKIVVTK